MTRRGDDRTRPLRRASSGRTSGAPRSARPSARPAGSSRPAAGSRQHDAGEEPPPPSVRPRSPPAGVTVTATAVTTAQPAPGFRTLSLKEEARHPHPWAQRASPVLSHCRTQPTLFLALHCRKTAGAADFPPKQKISLLGPGASLCVGSFIYQESLETAQTPPCQWLTGGQQKCLVWSRLQQRIEPAIPACRRCRTLRQRCEAARSRPGRPRPCRPRSGHLGRKVAVIRLRRVLLRRSCRVS